MLLTYTGGEIGHVIQAVQDVAKLDKQRPAPPQYGLRLHGMANRGRRCRGQVRAPALGSRRV